MTTKEQNRAHYVKNAETLRKKALERYHADPLKDDPERKQRKRAYMKRYLETYQRKKLTPAERAERSRLRRERYASDPDHRSKARAQARASNARNPMGKRATRLRAEYGLTTEQYHAILAHQKGGCAICGRASSGVREKNKRERALSVDHCHKTKCIRGLLCPTCNAGLGHFKDSPALLAKAIEYLAGNGAYGVI